MASISIVNIRLSLFNYLSLWFLFTACGFSQTDPTQGSDYLRIMFYNVENLFDTEDDPVTNDDEFTPEGRMRWTQNRYIRKRNDVFRVIAHVGGWDPPAVIALCEIENRKVLTNLVKNTPLVKYPYKILHKDSPDQRGIDVAFLYRSDYLQCVSEQYIRIFPETGARQTREILYAVFLTTTGDTLHLFVNHWPSRSGGQRSSDPSRMLAATKLSAKTDSIFHVNPMAKIIITGDLNDTPSDKSIVTGLKAHTDTTQNKTKALFNLSAYKTGEETGTIKYQGRWSVFDQFIVSGGLLRGKTKTSADQCHIFRADYLLEPDPRYSGTKPFRTFTGPRYNGGFSDHLPVYLDISIQ